MIICCSCEKTKRKTDRASTVQSSFYIHWWRTLSPLIGRFGSRFMTLLGDWRLTWHHVTWTDAANPPSAAARLQTRVLDLWTWAESVQGPKPGQGSDLVPPTEPGREKNEGSDPDLSAGSGCGVRAGRDALQISSVKRCGVRSALENTGGRVCNLST